MKKRRKPLKIFRVFIFDKNKENRQRLLLIFKEDIIKKVNRTSYAVKIFLIRSPKELAKKMQGSGHCLVIISSKTDIEKELQDTYYEVCQNTSIITIQIDL